MSYFTTPPAHRGKSRVMWCVGAVLLLSALTALFGFLRIRAQADSVPGSDSAARWTSAESPYSYAQLSLYYGGDMSLTLDQLYTHRAALEQNLTENSIVPENERARLYQDCFSGETTASLSSDRTTVSAAVTAAGGQFFFFHPMELISGSYFSEEDEMTNTAVLDDLAAWQLFGATDVAGLYVTLYGQPFRITGVVKSPSDPLEHRAYGDSFRVYINYRGLRLVTGSDRITCYEVLLPNPIRGFAADLLRKAFSVSEESTDILLRDSTTRFSFETLTGQIPDFFSLAMRTDAVIPPWWENIARAAEYRAIAWSAVTKGALILSAVLLAAFAALWFWIHPIRVRDILGWFNDRIEKKRMKRWLLRQAAQREHAGGSASAAHLPPQ